MICIIAIVVFGILGIFSAKYRKLAKEAFHCIFLRMTLRPCETGLNTRLKSKITSKLMRFPRLAKVWYKHFEAISWLFVGLMFISFFFMSKGIYNLATYGTCEPHSTTCIFNPGVTGCGSEHCQMEGCSCEQEGCQAPDYKACGEECTCSDDVCG